MSLILHYFKIAVRNLMKYKIQTVISILSIAIGIVTLSLAHSLTNQYRLPSIFHQPYYDRVYKVYIDGHIHQNQDWGREIIRAVKSSGNLQGVERLTVSLWNSMGIPGEFLFPDSTVKKGQISVNLIEPDYANFIGLKSAITGKRIRKLKDGEAIVSEDFVREKFNGKNPIGAIQTFTLSREVPPSVTIVDVYEPVALSDWPMGNEGLNFCCGNGFEDYDRGNTFMFSNFDIILKEGYSQEKVLDEFNDILKPYDMTAKIVKVSENSDIKKIISIRVLTYIIGSLILLAALIGFLRIQTQLFWLRRRELALRVVNGASRMKLFSLLFTEVAITICCALVLALVLGTFLQDFLDKNLSYFMDSSEWKIKDLWQTSIVIGLAMIAICCLIAWLTLQRVCRANEGITTDLQRGRHLFPKIMLGVQTVIIMIIVSSTFILIIAGDKILKACNVPENDSQYKEYLYWESTSFNLNEFYDEVAQLPELEKILRWGEEFIRVHEVTENPEAYGRYNNRDYFKIKITEDTTTLSSLGIKVEWLNKDIDHSKCMLIPDKLYSEFKEMGLLDHGTLTMGESYNGFTLPVGGIIKSVPYDMQGGNIIAISPEWGVFHSKEQILIPKAGRGKSLVRSLDELKERLDPENFNKIFFNYREKLNVMPDVVEAARIGGWILCTVSLIICAMSIFSSIALDTRGRRKEVAIRKVNGAKSRDIYKLFGKMYVLLISVSLLIAIPFTVLFNREIRNYVAEIVPGSTLSPVLPIILGIGIVTLLVFLIVWWQINRMMKVDPSKIIAKE